MIIQKTVMVRAHYKTRKWYESKGYNVPKKQRKLFEVKTCDLYPSSSSIIHCQCDYCSKEFDRPYFLLYGENKISCKDCSDKKRKETIMKEHGVEYIFQIPSVVQKIQNTQKENRKSDEYRKDVKEKRQNTYKKNHGYRTPFHDPNVVKKAQDTREKKYGHKSYFGINNEQERHDWQTKCAKTRYENGTTNTSKQQLCLFELFKDFDVKLNYPIDTYNVDVYFPKEKIALEYDGFGHFFYDDFFKRDISKIEEKRNNVILNQGIRIIRIVSKHDALPIDDIIKLFDYAKNVSCNFIVIDLDNEIIEYNEQKISFHEVLI